MCRSHWGGFSKASPIGSFLWGDSRELRKDAKMNQGQIRKMTSSIEISFLECWVTHLDLRAPWAPRTPGPWAGPWALASTTRLLEFIEFL